MADNNQKSDNGKLDNIKKDPLNELNRKKQDDFTTIETEVDPLDELDQIDDDEFLVYDNEDNHIEPEITPDKNILKTDEITSDKNQEKTEELLEKNDIPSEEENTEIDEDIEKIFNEISEKSSNNAPDNKETDQRLTLNKSLEKEVEPVNEKSETNVINNVKVDEEGVPLLNQFDSDKIKSAGLFHKFKINKHVSRQIITILVGVSITLLGIFYSLHDVMRISDHVTYGEHESLAIGIVLIGILIILLAFYKEILNVLGITKTIQSMNELDYDMPTSNKFRDDEDD